MFTIILTTLVFAATKPTTTPLGAGSHRMHDSAEYALELTQEYLVPALDLIKRSLPLGPLKGFRQVNLEVQGQKFVVNVPFMLTECTTVVSRTADILKCVDEKKQARLEVTGIPLRVGWVKELSNQLKDAKPQLQELNLEKSKQTLGSYSELLPAPATPPAQPKVQKAPTTPILPILPILDEMLCKKLAPAYNVTPALTQAFNCRLSLSNDQMLEAKSHRILLQKDGSADMYEFSIWYQDKNMAGYYTLIPMVALHSFRHVP